MKRLIFIFIFFAVFVFPVCAEDVNVAGEFDFEPIYDALGEDTAESIGSVEDFYGGAKAEGLLALALSALSSLIKPLCSDVIILFSAVAVIALVRKFSSAFVKKGDIIAYACIIALSEGTYSIIYGDYEKAKDMLLTVKSFYVSAIPIMSGMFAISGEAQSAVFSASSSSVIISLIDILCESIMLPASRICFAFSVASAVSDKVKLAPMADFIKSFVTKTTAFATTLVSSGYIISAKLAKAGDGVGLKIAKFSASAFIPVIGSAVSEACGAIMGSASLLRSAFGTFGVFAVAYLILPVFLTALIHRSLISLCSAFAKVLDLQAESEFLSCTADNFAILISVLSCVAVCFLIALGIFIGVGGML